MVRRHVSQLLATLSFNPFLSRLMSGLIYRGPLKKTCVPVLNCYSCPAAAFACPLGSLQSSLSGVQPRFPAYVLGLLLLFGLIFGKFSCGWLCPFGFLQDLLAKVPVPKLKKSAFTRQLSRLKYLWALLFVIVLPLAFWQLNGIGVPAFCKYLCPAGTLEGSVPLLAAMPELRSAAGAITVWKFALLGFLLVLMLFAFRPFCRWLCPLGAFLGLFNRYAACGIAVDHEHCTRCGHCADVCRLDTEIAGDRECISCGDCLEKCPVKAIYFRKPFNNNKQSM